MSKHQPEGPPDDTTRALTAAPDGTQERTGAVPPLDRESLRGIVGNAVANWWTAPAPSKKIADALWPPLEHMQSAAAGSHEGVRLWMADCGELTAKHRERAGYWHKRWTAACERADEDGRQAVSQHVRILEMEQRAEAAEAKLATVAAYCRNPGHAYVGHLMAERILAIIGTERGGVVADSALERLLTIISEVDAHIDARTAAEYQEQPLARHWSRITKVCSEAGEVMDALSAVTGENPRKGVHGTWDQVTAELGDVLCAAAFAIQHVTKDEAATAAVVMAAFEKAHARVAAVEAGRD